MSLRVKYCILIVDGASGWPLPQHGGRTCLELARTPNLDAMAREGAVGLARTIPQGMEPSSACACMSVLGYDPRVYYRGRSGIEARAMGVPVAPGEVAFRCNLVTVSKGRMRSYASGHISTEEARPLIAALGQKLGGDDIHFYPGVGYRHLCKIAGHEELLGAICTPPHDIPGRPIADFLPRGPGSELLRDIMERSRKVLRDHPVNAARRSRGEVPATMVWLFWPSGQIPEMPPFRQVWGLSAAMTSGVDLLRGLARMAGMRVLEIPGVTDGLDNDYVAQTEGALAALEGHDLVAIHVEAPDEAGHAGSVEQKVEAIEAIDREMVGQVRARGRERFRVLLVPDHPTPIEVQTHVDDPVPFLMWGQGLKPSGVSRFTEAEAKGAGILIEEGHTLLRRLVAGQLSLSS
ncbi:MAG: cofactor-independent phosphoglycerate mutase [Chloroflexota bacterium]